MLFGLIKTRSPLANIPDAGTRPIMTVSGAAGAGPATVIAPATMFDDVRIKDNSPREDAPKFSREYRARVGKGITVEIGAATWFGSRRFTGWLYQSNGRAILFFPNEIADKIIRPEIAAAVEQFMAAVRVWDREFIASCTEFTDENGNTWVLKKSLPRQLRAA